MILFQNFPQKKVCTIILSNGCRWKWRGNILAHLIFWKTSLPSYKSLKLLCRWWYMVNTYFCSTHQSIFENRRKNGVASMNMFILILLMSKIYFYLNTQEHAKLCIVCFYISTVYIFTCFKWVWYLLQILMLFPTALIYFITSFYGSGEFVQFLHINLGISLPLKFTQVTSWIYDPHIML